MRVPKFVINHYMRTLTEAMEKSGIHPALIYAFQKTERIITEENMQYLTEDDLLEWDDALAEWFEQHPDHSPAELQRVKVSNNEKPQKRGK